ncbi:unnamed protein product [Gordionus sp. m RMFG-2023]
MNRYGKLYSKAGMFEECVNDLTLLLSFHDIWEIYFLRALHHILLNNLADAEADLNSALSSRVSGGDEEDPEDCPVMVNFLGTLLTRLGRPKEVLALYYKWDRCVVTAQSIANLANTYNLLGDAEQSLSAYATLPRNSECPIQNFDRKVGCESKGENNANQTQRTHYEMGLILYRFGRLSESSMDFRKCLDRPSLTNDDINSYTRLRCVYYTGLVQLNRAQFYDSLLTFSKIFSDPQLRSKYANSEYFRSSIYLREYARYLHNHLDTKPFAKLDSDQEIDWQLRHAWLTNTYLDINDVT